MPLFIPGTNTILADLLKGSYYANPVVDNPDVSPTLRESYPEYYNQNICTFSNFYEMRFECLLPGPKADEAGVEGFEAAFKDLGK